MDPAAHRVVTLELQNGERVVGTLIHATDEVYSVRVEDRSLQILDSDVVQLYYEQQTPHELDLPEDAEPVVEPPVRVESLPLEGSSPADVLFGETAVLAVLDGARIEHMGRELRRCKVEPIQLYPGEHTKEQLETAPCLVPVEPASPLAEWLTGEGWGDHWGIYLQTVAEPRIVVEHLRGLLRVVDPQGRTLAFRFYDPRVLRIYLPTLNAHESAFLFGGAWRGRPGVRDSEKLVCPVCDGELQPLQPWCPECRTKLGGASPGAPFLIDAICMADEDPRRLLRCRPWPEVSNNLQSVPMRRDVWPKRGPRVLAIREEQIDALSADYELRQLVPWAEEHLQRVFPKRCAQLGPEGLRAAIRSGHHRARQHGLVENEDIARFLDVMFCWDLEFDTHAEGPWREILADPELDGHAKAERLWETAKELVAAVRARSENR